METITATLVDAYKNSIVFDVEIFKTALHLVIIGKV